MTALRQAAETALAALENNVGEFRIEGAMNALREALAQLDKKCEAGPSLQDLWDCWDVVHSGKQEPTAWMDAVGDLTFRTPSVKLRPYWTPLYLHPTPVPEGWQLVPVEPTDEMIAAAEEVKQYELNTPWRRWEAMLAAAPKYEE